jgi:adenosylhomocysteine nucleosidase
LIFRGSRKDLKVLVTFAIETEFARWRKRTAFRQREVGAMAVYHAQIGHADVDVVLTGVGLGSARRAMEAVMDSSYSLCISSGFAGGLKAAYAVGDLLVAESVRTSTDSGALQCNSEFVAEAEESGARRIETLLSAEAVVGTASQKVALADIADAVDMESYAIVASAQRFNVPVVVIRAVSDSFNQDMPMDFSEAISEDGRVLMGTVLREVAAHPAKIPGLIRLGRQSNRAAERLADFLTTFIETTDSFARSSNLLEETAR